MQGAGGAERVAATLCNHWVTKGYKVTLMPTFLGRGQCDYPLDSRVQLDYLADYVMSTKNSTFNKIRRLLTLRKILKKENPDIVISFLSNVNIAALLATRGLNIPVIVSERTYPPKLPLPELLEKLRKLTYPWAKWVIVQTPETMEWQKSDSPKSDVKIIPNPVIIPIPCGEPIVDPRGTIKQDTFTILSVGRLVKEKGFDDLINAFSIIHNKFSQWNLVILGEGEEREALQKQIDTLQLSDCITMPGQVGNVAGWYTYADLYVMSSHFEGFPNALLEAMSYGIPAISYDCPVGPRNIISHRINGTLVPLEQGYFGLAGAIINLIEDESLRQQYTEKASLVLQHFSINSICNLWDEALGETDITSIPI